MALKIVLLSTLVVAALAENVPYRPPTPPPTYGPPTPTYSPPRPTYNAPAPSYGQQQVTQPKYDFNWAVKDDNSGNNYGHQESRDGYDTQGSYYVQLPDGRLQQVTYTVNGDSGFVAQVAYQGEAQYPQQHQGYGAPAPSYRPPTQSYQQPHPTYP